MQRQSPRAGLKACPPWHLSILTARDNVNRFPGPTEDTFKTVLPLFAALVHCQLPKHMGFQWVFLRSLPPPCRFPQDTPSPEA